MVDRPVAPPQQLRHGPSLAHEALEQMGWTHVSQEAWVGESLHAL